MDHALDGLFEAGLEMKIGYKYGVDYFAAVPRVLGRIWQRAKQLPGPGHNG